jgi:hypothetical protein
MSVGLVRDEIARFLGRAEPEVLCIRGKWGVGKTYTWTTQLEAAQKAKTIALLRYSYVSLFGVNTIDELKFAIFENVITLSEGVRSADLSTLNAYVSKLGSWRKLTRIASSLPIFKNWVGTDATSLVSFMTIREQIVCIDDLERRGQKLEVSDVLGLISYLREQRRCKIVLILNDEQLEGAQKREFQKNLEKVVDLSLVYQPQAEDSTKIAVGGVDELSNEVGARCVALGIANIRVITRILKFASAIQPILQGYDPHVLKTAINSIALFSWAHDQPEQAPSLEYLKGRTVNTLRPKDNAPPEELAWNSLLEAYGYNWTDDFDLVLLEGVCRGYFDPDRVKKAAQAIHEQAVATRADGSFEEAWRSYHDSFDNNADEVLDGIRQSFLKNYRYITPTNLNGTVCLFKDLGRSEQARELLDYYVANRKEDSSLFDLEENPFGADITDADVRDSFKVHATKTKGALEIGAVMLAIKGGWSDEQLTVLATAEIEDYRRAFKSHSGQELRRILSNVFQFDRIANSSDAMKEIPRRAREALRQIGGESLVNARRVARFGVKVESSPQQLTDRQNEGMNEE